MAWGRVLTPSLEKMLETWLRTVFSLLASDAAIAALSRPRAISVSTAVFARGQSGLPQRP
jgi:hypothetical protein